MGLEEIENRLGSLVKPETISHLKSTVWKERLEGLSKAYLTLLFSKLFLYFHSIAGRSFISHNDFRFLITLEIML